MMFFVMSLCFLFASTKTVKAAGEWSWETDTTITPSSLINGNYITCRIDENSDGAALFYTNNVIDFTIKMTLYRYSTSDSSSPLSQQSITRTYDGSFMWNHYSGVTEQEQFFTFDFRAGKNYVGNYYYVCQYEWSGSVQYYGSYSDMTGDTYGGTRKQIAVNNALVRFNANANGGTVDGANTKALYAKYQDVQGAPLYTTQQGSTTAPIPVAVKPGYVFDGWYTDASGGTKVVNANGSLVQQSISGWTTYMGYYYTWNILETNKWLYAQFNDGIKYFVYLNDGFGNTGSSPAFYYKYGYSTQIGSDSSRRCYYWTNSNLTTCVNSPTNPLYYVTTVPTKTNYTFQGYYTGQKGTGTRYILSSGLANTSSPYLHEYTNNNDSTVTLYANWKINNPATPTITGGATKIYNSTDTALTCATTSTYDSGINLKYSFGYATSDGGTPSNWTTPTESNVYVVPKDDPVGQRWYSCRVYAEDTSGYKSDTVTSSASADAAMTINNASITFNVSSNGGTISGTSPLYSKYGVASLYTGIRNTTAGTIPTATKTGYEFTGWWTAASGGTKVINADKTVVASVSGWTNASKQFLRTSNSTLYAQFTIANPATPTISGGETKVYNSSATTLTCATSTTYSTGINKYYSFGYATSDGGTPSNWTTPTTTNTLIIAKDEPVGQKWYSCRVYATDGTLTSNTVTSLTTADTAMTINNASITFNVASNGGTISGTSPLYSKYGVASLYTGIRNTTVATIPTATKTGYTFNGWWTDASNGSKVINADKSVVASVSGWTNANKQFLITANSTLYAQFKPNVYSVTLDNQSGTTTGTPKVWYEYNTTKTINNETCYYYTDSGLTTCLGSYTINLPTKDHYVFDGYYTEPNGKGTEYVTFAGVFTNNIYQKMPSQINNNYTDNITLYANWVGEPITVTLPDNTTETYHYGDSYTLGENNATKANDNGALITFKYQDDETNDTTDYVTTSYTPNGWLINDVEYDDNEVIVLTEPIVINYNYNKSYTSPVFPEPTREHYVFDGWFDQETGGNEVTSYTGLEDITLYAHWSEDGTIPVTKLGEVLYVPYGTELNLGINDYYEFYGEAEYVWLDYNLGDGSDAPMTIMVQYLKGNGWLVDGVHYDDNSVITITEPITIERDNVIDEPPFILPTNITNGNKYFAGWYEWGNFDSEPCEVFYGGGDVTFVARWIDDPVNLTIDGKTKVVERGTEYVVPNGQLTDDNYITIYVSDWIREIDNKAVKIGYGKSINYQNINGNNYEPGYKYIVNEDTTVITNMGNNDVVVMDPYIETPTTIEYDDTLYVFSGWLFNNWDYIDPMDISIDLNKIKPSDVDLEGQGIFAEYSIYDPETQALIHYKDEYSGIDFTRVVDKGYEFYLDDISTSENVTIQLVDTIDWSRSRGNIEVYATVDHYLINNNEYDPDSSTYIKNEDTDIEVVRIISTAGEIGGYGFLMDVEPPARINEYFANNYLFMGIFTEQEGQGQILNIREMLVNHKFYETIDRNIYGFIYFLTDSNIILSVDDEISVIEKGVGVIPEGKEKPDDVIPITLDYQDGETPNEVKNITTTYNFEGYMKQNYWRVYIPGEEYDYEEDTYFYSSFDKYTTYDELPYIDDDHFKGWWTEPDGGDRIDELEYMLWYYEDYGYNTLYAHWGEPTVEICHGKGDCEEIVKGTAVTLEQPEPTVTTAHFTLDYNTEEPGYDSKEVTTTRTETVEYYMINDERYDFGETYVFNENCDMYGVTTLTYTSDFEGYYSDNWDYGLNINGYELRGWCATTDGRYCRHYDEGDDIVQPDGLTLYATYYQSEGDTVRVTVDWNWDAAYDWPKGESELFPDSIVDNIEFYVPEDYYRDIYFDLNNGSGDIETGRVAVTNEFSHFRVGNDDVKKYQQHDLYTFYRDIHIQSMYDEIFGEIEYPEMNDPTFKGWYTRPEGGKKISTTEDFTKYMDVYNDFYLYAQYYEGLPTSFYIDTEDITLTVGEVHQIGTTFIPDNTFDILTYTGFDSNVISIVDGLVTGLHPGTTTITVGTENTDITETVTVTVIGVQLSSETLDIVDKGTVKIVIGSEPNTYISDFIDEIDNDISNLKIYDKDNNLIDSSLYDTLLLTTNMTLKLVINDITYDEAVVIIRGDIDGDGIVDVTDESLIMDHILEISLINGNSMYAADLEEDEIIDVSDDSKIMDYILEIVDTLNGGV